MGFSSTPWLSVTTIIFFVILLLLAVFLIKLRQDKVLEEKSLSHKDKEQAEKIGRSQTVLMILVGLTILLVGLTVFYTWPGAEKRAVLGDSDKNSSFITFLPVWIAIFIPIIASKKKPGETVLDKDKRIKAAIVLALIVFLAAGVFLFYLTFNR